MDNQQNINYKPEDGQPQVVQPQWQYQSGQLQPQSNPLPAAPQPLQQPQNQQMDDGSIVSWSASEFIAHEKPKSWYLKLALVATFGSAVIYIITREIFSVIVVVVLSVALGVYGGVKPRTLKYSIYPEGIMVGDKIYPYESFRSFSVLDDTQTPSIQFLPQKRFMVPISIYCSSRDVNAISEILGEFLPYEHKERDMVDKISSRIKFWFSLEKSFLICYSIVAIVINICTRSSAGPRDLSRKNNK